MPRPGPWGMRAVMNRGGMWGVQQWSSSALLLSNRQRVPFCVRRNNVCPGSILSRDPPHFNHFRSEPWLPEPKAASRLALGEPKKTKGKQPPAPSEPKQANDTAGGPPCSQTNMRRLLL